MCPLWPVSHWKPWGHSLVVTWTERSFINRVDAPAVKCESWTCGWICLTDCSSFWSENWLCLHSSLWKTAMCSLVLVLILINCLSRSSLRRKCWDFNFIKRKDVVLCNGSDECAKADLVCGSEKFLLPVSLFMKRKSHSSFPYSVL